MTPTMRLRLSVVLSALWFLGLVLWPHESFDGETFTLRLVAGIAAIFVTIYGAAWIFAPASERKARGIGDLPQWAIVAICLVIMALVLGVPKLLIR